MCAGLAGSANARNSHQTEDTLSELQYWHGAISQSFVESGCAPAVPSSTLTFPGVACAAYVRTSGQLRYIAQDAAPLGPLNSGDGLYWLFVHTDTTTAVVGLTREPETHYFWKFSTTEPLPPTNTLLFARVTVAANSITAVEARSVINPAHASLVLITDPVFGLNPDPTVDASAAIQSAMNIVQGRCIAFPRRTYIVSTALVSSTSGKSQGVCLVGAGQHNTIFDNRVASGAMLTIDGSGTASQYQADVRLAHFSITTTTQPGSSHGLSLKGIAGGEIGFLCIGDSACATGGLSPTGDGIRFVTTTGDADSPSQVVMHHLTLAGNAGMGLTLLPASGILSLRDITLTHSQVLRNSIGGIRWHGQRGRIAHTRIAQNGNTTNGVGGLYVPFNSNTAKGLTVTQCEFDSNAGAGNPGQDAHIVIDSLQGGMIEDNRFMFQNLTPPGAFAPSFGIILGDGTNPVTSVMVERSMVFSSPTNPSTATTFVQVPAVGGSQLSLTDTVWQAFSGANATRYVDTKAAVRVRDDHKLRAEFYGTVNVNGSGGGNIFPNAAAQSAIQRYTILSPGNYLVGLPTNPRDGGTMILQFVNNHATESLIQFDTLNFPGLSSKTLRATPDTLTVVVVYDATAAKWYKIAETGLNLLSTRISLTANTLDPDAAEAGAAAVPIPGLVAECALSASPDLTLDGNNLYFTWHIRYGSAGNAVLVVLNMNSSIRTYSTRTWNVTAICP